MRNGPYILMIAPKEYPGKKYRGRYIYEHHYVWWKETGNLVPVGYNIHHKDHNKHNNKFSNLELLTDKEHKKEHGSEKFKSTICSICFTCEKGFELETRSFKSRIKVSNRLFCSRSCQVKTQQKERFFVGK